MKITEILLEYRRDVTAKNLGVKLILAIARDGGHLPPLPTDYESLRGITADRIQKWIDYPGGSDQVTDLINAILEAIESKDPTQNKQYTQWLARAYSNGGLKFEDINRHNLLGLYIIAKRRQMIKPEHADINRFKTYKDFENAIFPYDLTNKLRADDEKKVANKGKSKEVYKDADVRIIVPEDEAAACYYGQGTKWCTASTEPGTKNYFNHYNSNGTLYILLPTQPEHPGEKYQLHFADSQFMNENDDPIDVNTLLTDRFPNTLNFFKKVAPEMANMIAFVPEELLQKLITEINTIANNYIANIYQREFNDESYSDRFVDWLKKKGYKGNGDNYVDWEKAYNDNIYLEWDDEMKDFIHISKKALSITPEELKKLYSKYKEDDDNIDGTIYFIPKVIGYHIMEMFGTTKRMYGLQNLMIDNIEIQGRGNNSTAVLV